MVLAAGFGTRLRPLTDECPKCLVPVGDRPMLSHIFDLLEASGWPSVVVNAHHRADEVVAFAAGRAVVSRERELLGTAGGLAHAASLLGRGPTLVWNADVWMDVDPTDLLRAHTSAPDAEATLVVRLRSDAGGNVGLDGAGRVVRIRGGPVPGEIRSADFLSLHVVGETLRRSLPERGCLVGDVYIPALGRGAVLRTFAHDGPVLDVGEPRTYQHANLAWLAGRALDGWAHPEARVGAHVRLARSVVGAGATVHGAGRLERVIVWPGATATAPLADAVVTPAGVVPIHPPM